MDDKSLNADNWHRRLGHSRMDEVKLMHDKELVYNMKCAKGAIN